MDEEDENIVLALGSADEGKIERPEVTQAGDDEEVVKLTPAFTGGKMPIMRSSEPVMVEKQEIQEEEPWETANAEARKSRWGWVGLLACVFAGGIVWSLVQINRAEEKQDVIVNEAASTVDKEMQENLEAEAVIHAVELAARAFFASGSVDEMLLHVRHPQRVKPMMEEHYRKKPLVSLRIKEVLSLDPLTIDKRAAFWMVTCQAGNGEECHVLVETIPGKEAKVDWESYVCHQPMEWDEFVNSRPAGYTGDFRVYVEPDSFYSYEFSDSEKFTSFRITALNGEEVLFGYVPRNSELEQRMMETISPREGTPMPMLLRLHVPEGSIAKRSVIVEEMVLPRWLFVEDPGSH